MTDREYLDKLREDKNIYRNFLTLRKIYAKLDCDRTASTSVMMENYLNLGKLMIMIKLDCTIETVDHLLVIPLDGSIPLEIRDPYEGFMKLFDEYGSAKEFAQACGVSESWVSLHRSKRRRMTLDKLIALCQTCGRSYTVI